MYRDVIESSRLIYVTLFRNPAVAFYAFTCRAQVIELVIAHYKFHLDLLHFCIEVKKIRLNYSYSNLEVALFKRYKT